MTHRNLVANGRSIADNLGLTGDDVNVSWLPFYHDMGLLGGVLQHVDADEQVLCISTRG